MNDLAGAPIRRLGVADLAACQDLAEDRDWGRETDKWRFLLDAGEGFGIDDPAGGGSAAAVVVTRYAPVTGSQGLAAIGMLLVASRHSRRGLGARLVRHAIDHAQPALVSLYSTVEGRPLYDRFGFRVATGVVTYEGAYEPDPSATDHGVRPATTADLPAVAARDREVSAPTAATCSPGCPSSRSGSWWPAPAARSPGMPRRGATKDACTSVRSWRTTTGPPAR